MLRMATPLLTVLIVATLLETLLSLWLSRRQIAHVRSGRGAVPADFADSVSLAEHQKAADYTAARERLSMLRQAWQTFVMLAWLLGGFDLLYGLMADMVQAPLARSVCFVLALLAVGTLLSLPFALWSTFAVEQRFGFNRATPWLFLRDRLLGWSIGLVVAVPLLAACFWLMAHARGPWWLYVWVGLSALMLIAPAAYARLIAPRFNRFTPLPDGELRQNILSLLRETGFSASALFTMDASRRSTHGNAYFIGFGRAKRIVLFDTLTRSSTVAEIRAIVAHELGHFRHRHVLFGLVRSGIVLFGVLAAFGWLAHQPWLLPSMGLRHADPALRLVACVLCWSLLATPAAAVSNLISRRNEFQADEFARRQAGAAPMISALSRLSRANASTLTPDPLYALYHYSHPPVPQRIARLRRMEAADPDAPSVQDGLAAST